MHKTFISYHHAKDQDLKDLIIEKFSGEYFIDKSVSDGDISTTNTEETIMRIIRENFLSDSTITLVIVGYETARRPFVNSEIQASLWGSNHNGLLAVVRDELYDQIYQPSLCTSPFCNCGITLRSPTNLYTYYLPELVYRNHEYDGTLAHYTDDQVYFAVMKYSMFIGNPEKYIDEAFEKRNGNLKIKKKFARNSYNTAQSTFFLVSEAVVTS
ncbi:TIR domain-containing protein [uncultured Paenibacillus sp.]|uniref:TIR domain-containing protein n=1 Tax=uncultured Paenibacillus sp. TaxID=227322 RepID=UPI0015B3472C|nr:TIR domain-containing protein [uncultured Paenibacillus sp.]